MKELTGQSFRDVFGDISDQIMNMYWSRPTEKKTIDEWTTPEIHKVGEFQPLQANADAWDYIVKKRGITMKFVEKFGVYAAEYARINGQYVGKRVFIDGFYDGDLRTIECRDYTGEATRKVLYPNETKSDFLFNQDNVASDRDVVVVEGIMDLARVWEVYDNVVSGFGSSFAKRPLQAKALKLWGRRVVAMTDGDLSGLTALQEIYDMMDSEFWIAEFPPGIEDAGEATAAQIETALRDKKLVTDWLYGKRKRDPLSWW